MTDCPPIFDEEARLVEVFLERIGACLPWLTHRICCEFDYTSGRTDVLSLSADHQIIAFEAKLTDWRKALHQAWRNTSFANRAYVVLPRHGAQQALRHRDQFEKRGVGLCVVDDGGIEVMIESTQNEPVLPWLHDKAKETLIAHGARSDRR